MTPDNPSTASPLFALCDEPVPLADCPIGLFVADSGELCVKSEYGSNEGRIDAYIVSSGEMFWGAPPQTIASMRAELVRPLELDKLKAAIASPTTGQVMSAEEVAREWYRGYFGRDAEVLWPGDPQIKSLAAFIKARDAQVRAETIEEAAKVCDERAEHWRSKAHEANDDTSRLKAVGMWTGFECAGKHVRALAPLPQTTGG